MKLAPPTTIPLTLTYQTDVYLQALSYNHQEDEITPKKEIELEKYIERKQRTQEQQLEKRKQTKNTIQKRIEVIGFKNCPLTYTHLIINIHK